MTENETHRDEHRTFDAFLPAEMAQRAEEVGVKKANMPFDKLFVLAILAGAFIALGAIFSTTVTAGLGATPYGIGRLLAGLTFSLGLILVVVAGAELFTGNNLVVMAFASGKVSLKRFLLGWLVVYVGNFVGAFATAVLIHLTPYLRGGDRAVELNALNIAIAKCSIHPIEAFFSGVLCNALVCLAVWLCFSCRTTTDKILAIVLPIAAFVAAGFEHCVANMYFVPLGILMNDTPLSHAAELYDLPADTLALLNWQTFITINLIPVTRNLVQK
ncbi:MAG: formate/nitrite transporter family protein [Pirellulaceae bacterium]